jgi:hypothetical protein
VTTWKDWSILQNQRHWNKIGVSHNPCFAFSCSIKSSESNCQAWETEIEIHKQRWAVLVECHGHSWMHLNWFKQYRNM